MTDMANHNFESAQPARETQAAAPDSGMSDNATQPIGVVLEIAGSGSQIALDLERLNECMADDDPSVALAGQVGSQIKIRVGDSWLLASVRNQRQDRRGNGIIANIDFLGEGQEEKLTGRIHSFRRGVTRYPVPGALIYPASTADLRLIYASDGRSNIQIGTVYPTKDIRAGLYIDAMLGKHFALLGSTGTGKSTSAALILHRICEAAPEGHIVMIDPHGEYSAAFKNTGLILDVSNLQMPYWLMNFEEHCEVLLTSNGNERQIDMDILAKCLLRARSKNRLTETMGKITVDSPVPYLLSDLSTAISDEMGKLDKATTSAPFMRIKNKLEQLKAIRADSSPACSRRHDGGVHLQDFPHAERRQTHRDHRRVGRAVGHYQHRGRGAQPARFRLRDLGAGRTYAADPARLRRGASLRTQRKARRRQFGRPDPRPHRQGGP